MASDAESQLVRHHNLLAMLERLAQSSTLEASAQAMRNLRHISGVDGWRLLLDQSGGYLRIDGAGPSVEVAEFVTPGPWDCELMRLARPQLMDLSGRSDAPDHLRAEGVRQVFALPLRRAGQPDCALAVATRQPAFSSLDLKFLRSAAAVLCDHIWVILMRGQLIEALRRQALYDGLTSLPNRRALTQALEDALQSGARGKGIGVLIADVDDFKKVNDTFGHAAGDDVLREVGGRMSALVRDGDILGRFGGEEFMAIVRDCDDSIVQQVGERLRTAVSASPIVLTGSIAASITVTVSVGVTCAGSASPSRLMEVVHRADSALYEAKRSGRNRVCLAPSDGPALPHPRRPSGAVALPGRTQENGQPDALRPRAV